MLTALLIEFIFFSFFGWVVDSLYRNIGSEEILLAPLFTGPFALVYGLAVLIASGILKLTRHWRAVWRISVLSLAMILLEYVSAAFCDKILGFKLWNYDNSFMNLHGYIDFIHSVEWIISMIIFYYFVFPYLEKFEIWTKKRIPKSLDWTIFFISVVLLGALTVQQTLRWRTIYPTRASDSTPCGYCTTLEF